MKQNLEELIGTEGSQDNKVSSSGLEEGELVVEMKNITKKFPRVVANDGINYNVKTGEIHALLGENGAGKTTLMNILSGLYQQDEGEIYVRGEKEEINSPKDARRLGIGKVHQLFKQVSKHTVVENIALTVPTSQIFPIKGVKEDFKKLSEEFGWKIDPETKIRELSASQRQKVEILKPIYRGAEILILDEPTSVLTPQEKENLFDKLKEMRNENYAITYITHKLDEVFRISDRVTVLRDGKKVETLSTDETDEQELARLMTGEKMSFELEKEPLKREKSILEVSDLYVQGDYRELAVEGVSFTVSQNEVLGLAGIGGNGQKELIEALNGLRKVKKGNFQVSGEDLTNASPRKIKEQGVAYIPENRDRALVPEMSVKDNLVLRDYYEEPYSKKLFLNEEEIERYAREKLAQYNIVASSVEAPVETLSGGNLQKLVLARELSSRPDLLIASYPTQGLDVQAARDVREMILKERKKGLGVFFTSEDLDELLNLSDRIAVMYEGKLMGVVEPEKIRKEELGLMMTGTPLKEIYE